FDLPRHDGVGDLLALEEANEAAQLAYPHPLDDGGLGFYFRRGLFPYRGHRHVQTLIAGGLKDQKWKTSIACDQSVLQFESPEKAKFTAETQRSTEKRREERGPAMWITDKGGPIRTKGATAKGGSARAQARRAQA